MALRLLSASKVTSAFSTTKTAATMETEVLVVTSDKSMDDLRISSSPAEESNDSSVSGDLGFVRGSGSDPMEHAELGKVAELGRAVRNKDAENTDAGLEFTGKVPEVYDEVIALCGMETEIVGDAAEFSDKVRVVTSEVRDIIDELKTSYSVLEVDDKIADDDKRVSHDIDTTVCKSDPVGSDHPDSKDCNGKNATSSEPRDKLRMFKAKLDSDQTLLPPELLRRVTELAARHHVEADAMRLTSEFLGQPSVEFLEGLRQPENDWRREMEAVFMSYVEEADSKVAASKPKREKKKKSGEKTASDAPERVEPSHFVAIQITNPEIHEKLAEIQKSVVERKRILENALVNLPTLHLTLMVLYLKDNEQIERAKAALEASKTRVLENGKDLAALPFAGIGSFNGKVVFAKVKEGPELDRLKEIAETVRRSFEERELFSTDGKGFEAHLTFMKLSKSPWLFRRGIKKIDPDFYVAQKDDFLGSQRIGSLQLCAMKKGENGYYPIDHEVFFESERESD